MRTLSLLFLFLILLAPSASAHFHTSLVAPHALAQVRQTAPDTAVVSIQYALLNPGDENFTGNVYVAFPAGATGRQASLDGGPLVESNETFLRLTLPRPLPPGGKIQGYVAFTVTAPEGERLVVPLRTFYETRNLTVNAFAHDGYTATGIGYPLDAPRDVPAAPGAGTAPRDTLVAFDPEEGGVPKLAWLLLAAAVLIAGAAYWDRRRRRGAA